MDPAYKRGGTAGKNRRNYYDDYEDDFEGVPDQYRDLIEDIVEKRVQDRIDEELANYDPARKYPTSKRRAYSPDAYRRGLPLEPYGHPGYGYPYGGRGYGGYPYGRGHLYDYDPYYKPMPKTKKKADTWNPYTKKKET